VGAGTGRMRNSSRRRVSTADPPGARRCIASVVASRHELLGTQARGQRKSEQRRVPDTARQPVAATYGDQRQDLLRVDPSSRGQRGDPEPLQIDCSVVVLRRHQAQPPCLAQHLPPAVRPGTYSPWPHASEEELRRRGGARPCRLRRQSSARPASREAVPCAGSGAAPIGRRRRPPAGRRSWLRWRRGPAAWSGATPGSAAGRCRPGPDWTLRQPELRECRSGLGWLARQVEPRPRRRPGSGSGRQLAVPDP
jgi:hypothetical protein